MLYCVVTCPSFSTSRCWFVDNTLTLSSGISALRSVVSIERETLRTAHMTYVKPFTSLNSFVILPPCSLTCFLALRD